MVLDEILQQVLTRLKNLNNDKKNSLISKQIANLYTTAARLCLRDTEQILIWLTHLPQYKIFGDELTKIFHLHKTQNDITPDSLLEFWVLTNHTNRAGAMTFPQVIQVIKAWREWHVSNCQDENDELSRLEKLVPLIFTGIPIVTASANTSYDLNTTSSFLGNKRLSVSQLEKLLLKTALPKIKEFSDIFLSTRLTVEEHFEQACLTITELGIVLDIWAQWWLSLTLAQNLNQKNRAAIDPLILSLSGALSTLVRQLMMISRERLDIRNNALKLLCSDKLLTIASIAEKLSSPSAHHSHKSPYLFEGIHEPQFSEKNEIPYYNRSVDIQDCCLTCGSKLSNKLFIIEVLRGAIILGICQTLLYPNDFDTKKNRGAHDVLCKSLECTSTRSIWIIAFAAISAVQLPKPAITLCNLQDFYDDKELIFMARALLLRGIMKNPSSDDRIRNFILKFENCAATVAQFANRVTALSSTGCWTTLTSSLDSSQGKDIVVLLSQHLQAIFKITNEIFSNKELTLAVTLLSPWFISSEDGIKIIVELTNVLSEEPLRIPKVSNLRRINSKKFYERNLSFQTAGIFLALSILKNTEKYCSHLSILEIILNELTSVTDRLKYSYDDNQVAYVRDLCGCLEKFVFPPLTIQLPIFTDSAMASMSFLTETIFDLIADLMSGEYSSSESRFVHSPKSSKNGNFTSSAQKTLPPCSEKVLSESISFQSSGFLLSQRNSIGGIVNILLSSLLEFVQLLLKYHKTSSLLTFRRSYIRFLCMHLGLLLNAKTPIASLSAHTRSISPVALQNALVADSTYCDLISQIAKQLSQLNVLTQKETTLLPSLDWVLWRLWLFSHVEAIKIDSRHNKVFGAASTTMKAARRLFCCELLVRKKNETIILEQPLKQKSIRKEEGLNNELLISAMTLLSYNVMSPLAIGTFFDDHYQNGLCVNCQETQFSQCNTRSFDKKRNPQQQHVFYETQDHHLLLLNEFIVFENQQNILIKYPELILQIWCLIEYNCRAIKYVFENNKSISIICQQFEEALSSLLSEGFLYQFRISLCDKCLNASSLKSIFRHDDRFFIFPCEAIAVAIQIYINQIIYNIINIREMGQRNDKLKLLISELNTKFCLLVISTIQAQHYHQNIDILKSLIFSLNSILELIGSEISSSHLILEAFFTLITSRTDFKLTKSNGNAIHKFTILAGVLMSIIRWIMKLPSEVYNSIISYLNLSLLCLDLPALKFSSSIIRTKIIKCLLTIRHDDLSINRLILFFETWLKEIPSINPVQRFTLWTVDVILNNLNILQTNELKKQLSESLVPLIKSLPISIEKKIDFLPILSRNISFNSYSDITEVIPTNIWDILSQLNSYINCCPNCSLEEQDYISGLSNQFLSNNENTVNDYNQTKRVPLEEIMTIAIQIVGLIHVAIFATYCIPRQTFVDSEPPVVCQNSFSLLAVIDWTTNVLHRISLCGEHHGLYYAAHATFCLLWVDQIDFHAHKAFGIPKMQTSRLTSILPFYSRCIQRQCCKKNDEVFSERPKTHTDNTDSGIIQDTSTEALLHLASTSTEFAPWFSSFDFPPVQKSLSLDVLSSATAAGLNIMIWGSQALKNVASPISNIYFQPRDLWKCKIKVADLICCKNNSDPSSPVLRSSFIMLNWWLVNLGLTLTQISPIVTESFCSRIIPVFRMYNTTMIGDRLRTLLPTEILLKNASDSHSHPTTQSLMASPSTRGLVGEAFGKGGSQSEITPAECFHEAEGNGGLEFLTHGFSRTIRDFPRKIRAAVVKRPKKRSKLRSVHSRTSAVTSSRSVAWHQTLSAAALTAIFHWFSGDVSWPESLHVPCPQSCADMANTRMDVSMVVALRELLKILARYRKVASQGDNPIQIQLARRTATRAAVEAHYTQHQPGYAQLTLLELLVRDELIRRIVWSQYSKDINAIPLLHLDQQLIQNEHIWNQSGFGRLRFGFQLKNRISRAASTLFRWKRSRTSTQLGSASLPTESLPRNNNSNNNNQNIHNKSSSASVHAVDDVLALATSSARHLTTSASSSSVSSLETRNRDLSLMQVAGDMQPVYTRPMPALPNDAPLQLFVQRRGKLPLSSLRRPDQKRRLWRSLLQLAWDIAPPVVSQLLERFPTRKSLHRVAKKMVARLSDDVLWCLLIDTNSNSRILELATSSSAVWVGRRSSRGRFDSAFRSQSKKRLLCCCRGGNNILTRTTGDKLEKISSQFPWIYFDEIPLKILAPLLHRCHSPQIMQKRFVVIRTLEMYNPDAIKLLILELVQSLRWDIGRVMEELLLNIALVYPSIGQLLLFFLSAESEPVTRADGRRVPIREPDLLPMVSIRLLHQLQRQGELVCQLLKDSGINKYQFDFFEKLMILSGSLVRFPAAQRDSILKDELQKLPELKNFDPPLYLPTNASLQIKEILRDQAKLMQSAVKTPYLLPFKVLRKKSNIDEHRITLAQREYANSFKNKEDDLIQDAAGIIFKLNDDIRQDSVALQIIEFCQIIFERINLPLKLVSYNVIPHRQNGTLGGMIEVIPNAMSRHQLGRTYECSLSVYFRNCYGFVRSHDAHLQRNISITKTEQYQEARWQFLRSLAAYAVVSFLLQVKDRHNGNLLITSDGHLVHIDFGFLFDLSPGRDLRFEKAPFKLTLEMIEVLGGSAQSETFKLFEQLVIRGYLAIRQEAHLLLHLISVMIESGLPCFKKSSLRHFRERFQLEKSPEAAAIYMKKQILDSYNALSTRLYDVVQQIQQGIAR